jgi:hypothetical protein
MKRTLLIALALSFSLNAFPNCKPLRKAMHTARKVLKTCNKAWVDSLRGEATDPTDDCAQKQSEFISSVKEFKSCLRAPKAKK